MPARGDEDTQMMAEDYLRMGLAKVNAMELPVPYKPEQEFSKDILVVGGGLAGLTSAAGGFEGRVLGGAGREGGGTGRLSEEGEANRHHSLTRISKDNTLDELIQEVTSEPENQGLYRSHG